MYIQYNGNYNVQGLTQALLPTASQAQFAKEKGFINLPTAGSQCLAEEKSSKIDF